MYSKLLILGPALASIAAGAEAENPEGAPQEVKQGGIESGRSETGGQSFGDRNRGGGWGFYSFPRNRHVEGSKGGSRNVGDRPVDAGSPANRYDGNYGSAYYGQNYGAPYHGGGYYGGGTYYRERRDR